MSHIPLRPEQARQLLPLMHTPFNRQVGQQCEHFALAKGQSTIQVVYFRWPEQCNLQGTHANSSNIPVQFAGIFYLLLTV